jgi:hypothetical protein
LVWFGPVFVKCFGLFFCFEGGERGKKGAEEKDQEEGR